MAGDFDTQKGGGFSAKDIAAKNPLVLAFVGDAVWTLFVRERLGEASSAKAGALHLAANKYVNAAAQAVLYEKISPQFDATESAVAHRARNADNNTRPKNCTLAEYKLATAFEAVLGYTYLTGNMKRLKELFDLTGEIR